MRRTCCAVAHPARRSPSRGCAGHWMTRAAICPLPFARSPMQSMQSELFGDYHPPLFSGRTSRVSSQPQTTRSGVFLEHLPAKMMRSHRQGVNGRTLVVCLVPREQSRGESLTPNISAWPNDAHVCSLSQVLERGSIPQRFFLSGTACAGILRRAEKRGKSLPDALHRALRAVAFPEQMKPAADTSSQPVTTHRMVAFGEYSDDTASTMKMRDYKDATDLVAQPIAFEANMSMQDARTDGVNQTLTRRTHVSIAFDTTQLTSPSNYSNPQPGDPCHPLAAGAHPPALATTMQVRRLTPMECERLQGFPDNYTAIPWRGKLADQCPDGPRYKTLGNSWAVPCVRWIGERINQVKGIQ